jgi:hypothetical protein
MPWEPHRVKVDRRRAIREEIDTAIDLLLTEGSVVAIHVLAWAAADQSRELLQHLQMESFQQHIEIAVKTEYHNEFRKALKADYNFFKHADKDPERVLTGFRPEASTFALMMALKNYQRAFGTMTLPMHYFWCWWLQRNREFLSDEFRAALHLDGEEGLDFPKLSFRDSLAPASTIYKAYKADPNSHEERLNIPNSGFEFRYVQAA